MLGIGEAREADAERAPHGAAPAIGGDQIVAAKDLRSLGGAGGDADAVVVLRDLDRLVAEPQLDAGDRGQALIGPAHQLELLALQAIGMPRVPAQERQVEFGDLALAPVAVLHHRADQSHAQKRRGRAAFLEQIERRRMEGRGAIVENDFALALEHGHGNAALGEQQRRKRADRPAADDDHPIVPSHRRSSSPPNQSSSTARAGPASAGA